MAGFDVIPHPSYSPDLARSDSWLFSELKKRLNEQGFVAVDSLKEAIYNIFEGLPRSFYEVVSKAQPARSQKCLGSIGSGFEK